MKLLILCALALVSSFGCKAQEKVTLRYLGHQYKETKNKSFINQELIFLKSNDTFLVNIKMPFDVKNPKIINPGLYYNCHLKEDTVYTIVLKKICPSDIPTVYSSYYKINTVFSDKENCAKFTEVKKDTEYLYKGYYGMYVDVDNVLYEIIGLSPDSGCSYPH